MTRVRTFLATLGDDTVEMHFPVGDVDFVSEGMRALTRRICEVTGEQSGYGLGGEHGYGEEFENDVFEMHRYYWGDCTCGFSERLDAADAEWHLTHRHASDCYRTRLDALVGEGRSRMDPKWRRAAEGLCAEMGLTYPERSAVHCTCGHDTEWRAFYDTLGGCDPRCPSVLPNFRHKASGYTVEWYKYIGRGMEVENPNGVRFTAILNECMESLK